MPIQAPGNKLSRTFGKVIESSTRPPDSTCLIEYARIESTFFAVRPEEPMHVWRRITPYLTSHLFAASKT